MGTNAESFIFILNQMHRLPSDFQVFNESERNQDIWLVFLTTLEIELQVSKSINKCVDINKSYLYFNFYNSLQGITYWLTHYTINQ